MVHRVHILIDGRVQGVGFRYATYERAQAAHLHGWVRNLPDGRVEAEFEGSKPELEAMVDWCRIGPPHARVTQVEATWEFGPPTYADSSQARNAGTGNGEPNPPASRT